MDPVENSRAVAEELISYAREQGVDMVPFHIEGNFQKDQRWISLWRKNELPSSGPADEPVGTLHYSMQGTISKMPNAPQQPAGAFQREWSEAGTLESIERAVELVKGWLLDGKEVDDLPQRVVRRWGIG